MYGVDSVSYGLSNMRKVVCATSWVPPIRATAADHELLLSFATRPLEVTLARDSGLKIDANKWS